METPPIWARWGRSAWPHRSSEAPPPDLDHRRRTMSFRECRLVPRGPGVVPGGSATGQDHHRLLGDEESQTLEVEELGQVRPLLGEVLLRDVGLVLLHRLEPLLGHSVVLAVIVGPVVT